MPCGRFRPRFGFLLVHVGQTFLPLLDDARLEAAFPGLHAATDGDRTATGRSHSGVGAAHSCEEALNTLDLSHPPWPDPQLARTEPLPHLLGLGWFIALLTALMRWIGD
jgi:hypothetical protein